MNTPARLSASSARGTAPTPACTLVIFGAGGDLTKRLLIPALYNLAGSKLLDDVRLFPRRFLGQETSAVTPEAIQAKPATRNSHAVARPRQSGGADRKSR